MPLSLPLRSEPRASRLGRGRRVIALAAAALLAVTARPGRAAPPDGGAAEQPPMLRCFLPGFIPDILSRCFGGTNSSYRTYVALLASVARDTREMSTRYDITDTRLGTPQLTVWTPALMAAVEAPKGRWGVNVSMVVNVVYRDEPDVHTSASTSEPPVRYAPAVGGHVRFGDVDVNLRGSLSYHPEALSVSAGGGVSVDLWRKTFVPSLDYTFTRAVLGAALTPFSVHSHDVYRHAVEGRATIMLDAATLFLPMLAVRFEDGDTSRFYRLVPLFPDANGVPAGATVWYVTSRDDIALLEQLPTKRLEVAFGGLFARRFAWSTLRIEERLSADSWTVMATSTSVQWIADAGTRVCLWPDVRVHAQRGADFWRRAYVSDLGPEGRSVPPTRAGRIDLGPLVTLTTGAGVRVALDARKRLSVIVSGGVDYTRFLDHLYVKDRIGPFGTAALEADIH